MEVPQLLAHLSADAAAVRAAAEAAPEEPVPACPGWVRRHVVRHLCIAYGTVLAQLAAGPEAERGFDDAERAPKGDAAFAFFDAQVARVVDAMASLDPTATWPTWIGRRPATFFPRRLAHETAVHRVDVAGGAVDAALAVDGIDELLELAAFLPGDRFGAVTGSVHLHATDPGLEGGEWLVDLGPSGLAARKAHAKGDVAVRGAAGDLYLWAWNRVDLDDRFEVFGDEAVAQGLRTALSV